MINPVNPSPQSVQMLPVDAFAGQKAEKDQEIPRLVVDSKQETPSAREEIPREEVERTAEKLNRLMGLIEKRLKFDVHEKSHRIIVTVIDQETGDVLREIPPKKLLDLLSSFTEMAGVFIDKKV